MLQLSDIYSYAVLYAVRYANLVNVWQNSLQIY